MAEKTYTLEEAKKELARRECAANGHYWSIIETYAGTPLRITCETCGMSRPVLQVTDTEM